MFGFRLSYFERVKEMMPEAYESLLPHTPAFHYKYSMEGAGE